VFGKYNYFNKKVSDKMKKQCIQTQFRPTLNGIGLASEFGIDDGDYSESTSLDFDRFIETVDSPSINGLWYCVATLGTLTKKQKENLIRYIKEPSANGRLIITGDNWLDYKEYLRNKILVTSMVSSYIELSFPSRDIVKKIVQEDFAELGVEADSRALDYFMIKMSSAYDKYDETISMIAESHKEAHSGNKIDIASMKIYMKGIEYFVIEDFVRELMKPMRSDLTNSKKVLKIMAALEDDIGAKDLLYKTQKIVDESIEFRLLINKGIIPVGIKYFYKDAIADINKVYGDKNKFEKMSEYTFRRKAQLASETSIRDWVYIKLMISNALSVAITSDEQCKKALYEICTRSVLTKSRLNNIIRIDNVLYNDLNALDSLKFTERKK
jgi:hypothetical protein